MNLKKLVFSYLGCENRRHGYQHCALLSLWRWYIIFWLNLSSHIITEVLFRILEPYQRFLLSYLKIKKRYVFEVSTIVSLADTALWLLLSSLISSTCIYSLASDAEVTEAFVHVNAGLWVLKLTQTSPTNCELRAVIRSLNEKTCNWSKLISLLVKTMLEERMSWKTTKNL